MKTKDKIQNLKKELNFLYRVAKSVHSLETNELLKEIVKIASEVTNADSCLIYVLDSQKNELVLRASKNPHQKLISKITMKLGEGITGWVAREKKVVAIGTSAYKDPRFKFFSSLPEDKYEAFLSVPIVNKHGTVGVINIQHRKKHEHLEMEINLLIAIGKLVGGALENALLVEETLALREALEIRRVIEKAKGIIMKKRNINEGEAYRLLQKESMDSRKTLREVAEAIMLAEKLNIG